MVVKHMTILFIQSLRQMESEKNISFEGVAAGCTHGGKQSLTHLCEHTCVGALLTSCISLFNQGVVRPLTR